MRLIYSISILSFLLFSCIIFSLADQTKESSNSFELLSNYTDNDDSFNIEAVTKAIIPITYLLDHLSPQAIKSMILGAVHGKASWVVCSLCPATVSTIRLFPEVSTVQTIFTQICSRLNYEDSHVCDGIAKLYGEEIVYILKNSKLYANQICGLIISPSCMSESADFPEGKEWNLFKPFNLTDDIQEIIRKKKLAKRLSVKSSNSEKNISTILHLSDLHLDQKYQVNTYAHCLEPLCCRSMSVPSTKSTRAGYWGSFGKCDANIHNIENLFTTVTTEPFKSQYRYIIFTGDYIAHDIWLTTKEEIISTTQKLNREFKRRIPANKIVIPVIGNHEGHPVDQFCPPEIPAEKFHMNWLYEALLDQWREWIPESQHELFKKYGYYSIEDSNIRWIVLNMNYCNRLNFWVAYDYHELGDMLLWLQKELQSSLQEKQFVYITGHIAPDPNDCIDNWINAYVNIIDLYSPIIKGQFFGHTHFDEIRLYYNKENDPIGLAYLAPSVTTFGDVYPAFRLYNTNPDTGEIIDHRTFFFNITSANQEHLISAPYRESYPEWQFLYSARNSYDLPSLSTQDWHDFSNSVIDKPAMAKKYYQHYGRYDYKFMQDVAYESILNVIRDRIRVKRSVK